MSVLTRGVAPVHSEGREGHGPEGELGVGVATGGRGQDARVLAALQCGHGNGTHHRCGREGGDKREKKLSALTHKKRQTTRNSQYLSFELPLSVIFDLPLF